MEFAILLAYVQTRPLDEAKTSSTPSLGYAGLPWQAFGQLSQVPNVLVELMAGCPRKPRFFG